MLCKNCDHEIPDNQTVCDVCGTSALAPQSEKNRDERNSYKKQRSKRNKRSNVTYLKGSAEESKDSAAPESLKGCFPAENEITQEVYRIDTTDEAGDITLPEPEITYPPKPSPELQPQISKPEITDSYDGGEHIRQMYKPMGTEYVLTDAELPQPDNRHTLPESSGIIYEIAEELYRQEKTATEIEALCRPPFKKVFDPRQIEELNRQALEQMRVIVSDASAGQAEVSAPVPDEKQDGREAAGNAVPEVPREMRSVSTATAFLLQLLLFIPGINMIAAILFSFVKGVNMNIKAYTRAFIIWNVILFSAALTMFIIYFFSSADNRETIATIIACIK